MCMKRVVNHEDRRGGTEQQAPVDIQCLCQCWCGVIRCLWVESLEEGLRLTSGLGQRNASLQRSPAFSTFQVELHRLYSQCAVGTLRCVLSEGMQCELLLSFSSGLLPPSILTFLMMVKVLHCNEASCVAPGYSSMPLGEEFAEHHSACLTAAWWLCIIKVHHSWSNYHQYSWQRYLVSYCVLLLIFTVLCQLVNLQSQWKLWRSASLLWAVLKAGGDSNKLLGFWWMARNRKWGWSICLTVDLWIWVFSY